MNFDEWIINKREAREIPFGTAYELFAREAWRAAVEESAKICDDRAAKCAAKAESTDDEDDVIELKANAWQFSVLATEIRQQ